MSPKANSKTPKQSSSNQSSSSMMRRRRDSAAAADDALDADTAGRAEAAWRADGADADSAAPAAADGSPEADGATAAVQPGDGDHQIIGQELVPASQALVQRTPDAGKRGQERQKSQSATPQDPARSSQVAQDSQKKESMTQASPSAEGNGGDSKVIRSDPGTGQNAAVATPQGTPVSFGPQSFVTPEGQVQGMLPLFSPEQTARLQEIHSSSPMLTVPPQWATPERGPGGADQLGVQGNQGLMASLFQAYTQNPNDYVDMRQREQMWKYQIEFNMQQLGLQLRASQSENQRLREELKEALERKEYSRYGAPEGQSSSTLKEDGARAQQAPVRQEDGARAQQAPVRQEDGARAQQDPVRQEDGARAQQDPVRQEDGARAQQDPLNKEVGQEPGKNSLKVISLQKKNQDSERRIPWTRSL